MPNDDEGDTHFARIRREISRDLREHGDSDDTATWLQRLCASLVRALPASGAGVSLLGDNGSRGVAAASDQSSAVLEELQFTLGEGPCLSAFEERRPVLEGGNATSAAARWPAYWPAVSSRGVRAVFAFPLQIGAARLGVMDVYRVQPDALSKESVSLALTYAAVAVQTLLDGQQRAAEGDAAAGLDDALAYRLELYQAQGMVMVQVGVPLDEAMALLRAHAYVHDRSVIAVARDVVARRLRLDQALS